MARLVAVFENKEAMQQAMQGLCDAGFAPEQIPAGRYAGINPHTGVTIGLDTRGHEPDARSICLRAGAVAFHDQPDPVRAEPAVGRAEPLWLEQEQAIAAGEGEPAASGGPLRQQPVAGQAPTLRREQEQAVAVEEGDLAASKEPRDLGTDGVDSPMREIRVTDPGARNIDDLMRRGISRG